MAVPEATMTVQANKGRCWYAETGQSREGSEAPGGQVGLGQWRWRQRASVALAWGNWGRQREEGPHVRTWQTVKLSGALILERAHGL